MLGCSRSGNRSTPPATLSRFPLPCCTTNMCFRAFFVSYTCQRRSGVDHMVLIYHSLLITNTSILPAFFFPCSPGGINQRFFFFGGHLSPGPTRCVVLVNSGMFACPGSMIMCVCCVCRSHIYIFCRGNALTSLHQQGLNVMFWLLVFVGCRYIWLSVQLLSVAQLSIIGISLTDSCS